jgi:hypothetical protein
MGWYAQQVGHPPRLLHLRRSDAPPGRLARRFRLIHPGWDGTHNKSDILLVSSTFADPRLRFNPASHGVEFARLPRTAMHRRDVEGSVARRLTYSPGMGWYAVSSTLSGSDSGPGQGKPTISDGCIREGLPVSREPALLTSAGRMPERSQHRVSEGQDARSERPATGHGQPRAVASIARRAILWRARGCGRAMTAPSP